MKLVLLIVWRLDRGPGPGELRALHVAELFVEQRAAALLGPGAGPARCIARRWCRSTMRAPLPGAESSRPIRGSWSSAPTPTPTSDTRSWAGARAPSCAPTTPPLTASVWIEPSLLVDVRGPEAEALIDRIEGAVASYPFKDEYATWPGPNSNTFLAHVAREVPELSLDIPASAIGKDYRPWYQPAGSRQRHGPAGLAARPVGRDGGGRGRRGNQPAGPVLWGRPAAPGPQAAGHRPAGHARGRCRLDPIN